MRRLDPQSAACDALSVAYKCVKECDVIGYDVSVKGWNECLRKVKKGE